ncbi:lysylphosphatidylglycerol synthase transmembrane domain-containing protein [Halobacteriovorax sp. HFRX-2_2]|uniref:lysylphosphatidylglycerol synthase transmembrane domain-containing protein n=2 Tax=unclassified Halobacteriovorax TaxID=2639665 RepID=UPI00371277FA
MHKASIQTILKVIFAAAILTWLAKSDKLDLSLIGQVLENGPWALISLALLICSSFIAAFRWSLLLKTKSDKIHIKKIYPINLIGQFFSTFLPGIVTGDFLKLLYVRDCDKNLKRSFLLSTALIDRIIGLIGLLIVGGLSSIYFYSELTVLSPKVKPLISFNIMLLLGALGFVLVLFMPVRIKIHVIELIKILPIVGDKIANITETFWKIGESRAVILKSIGLSVIVHIFAITAFWSLVHSFLHANIGIKQLFSIIPVGLISIAIPISPAGAGVGHLVFEELFKALGQDKGASFFNLYFLVAISVNLLGVIPYVLWKKKHTFKEAEALEEVQ